MNGWVTLLALFGFSLTPAAPYRWVLMDQQRLATEEVLIIARDDLGNKYFATRKGLTWVNRGDEFRIFNREKTGGGLGSDSITSLGLDRYRSLWVGTDGGGLSVYTNGQWRRYTRANTNGGLPDDGVLALALYKEETWVATRNGFALLRGTVWTPYSGEAISGRLPHPRVTAIAVDSNGDKWLGTIGGLVKFTGTSWTRFNRANTSELPHDGVTYLRVDAKGSLWAGTQAGLARRERNGKWSSFQSDPKLEELAGEVVYSITLGPVGEIWACIKGGAVRYADGNWTVFTKNNYSGLLTRYVYYALPGVDNEVWFATGKGAVAMYPPAEEE